jgi:hypothetical protein
MKRINGAAFAPPIKDDNAKLTPTNPPPPRDAGEKIEGMGLNGGGRPWDGRWYRDGQHSDVLGSKKVG